MTDTHLWIDAEGGPYLPEAVTLIATASGRGDTDTLAVGKLWDDIAECWPGWRLDGDEVRLRRFVTTGGINVFEATAKIVKWVPA